jgi:hypothetical protein
VAGAADVLDLQATTASTALAAGKWCSHGGTVKDGLGEYCICYPSCHGRAASSTLHGALWA